MLGPRWNWRYSRGASGEVLAGATCDRELPHRDILALDSVARRNGATFTTWRGEPATADTPAPFVYAFRFPSGSLAVDERATEALFSACHRAGLIDVDGFWRVTEAAVPVVVTEAPEKSNSSELLSWLRRIRIAWAILRGRAACACGG